MLSASVAVRSYPSMLTWALAARSTMMTSVQCWSWFLHHVLPLLVAMWTGLPKAMRRLLRCESSGLAKLWWQNSSDSLLFTMASAWFLSGFIWILCSNSMDGSQKQVQLLQQLQLQLHHGCPRPQWKNLSDCSPRRLVKTCPMVHVWESLEWWRQVAMQSVGSSPMWHEVPRSVYAAVPGRNKFRPSQVPVLSGLDMRKT